MRLRLRGLKDLPEFHSQQVAEPEYELKCPHSGPSFLIHLFFKRIYLFIFRERGREGEREGEKLNVRLPLAHPHWGPGPQPRHVP